MIMKRFFTFLCAVSLLFCLPVLPARALSGVSDTVRVGLVYGGSAKAGYNALAERGFEIGYFSGNTFVNLMTTDATYVAAYADRLYQGAVSVKPYNIEVGPFANVDEAWSFAMSLSAQYPGIEMFPAYMNGQYVVHIDYFSTAAYAEADLVKYQEAMPELSFTVSGPGGVILFNLNNGKILFETDEKLALKPVQSGDEVVYLKNGSERYYGSFEFPASGSALSLVNVVNLEDYVCGVVPNEMVASWEVEALKVQAVCARGYAAMNMGKHQKDGFDLCATTHCQVYRGRKNVTQNVWQAVDGTRGEVVTYNGQPITTYFMASSGGYTESSANAWGGEYLPYYSAVEDPYSPDLAYSSTVTAAELTTYLQKKGYQIGNVVDCYISQYSEPAGNAYEVTVKDSAGGELKIKTTDKVRIAFGAYVKSPRFHITKTGGSDIYLNEGEKASGELSVIDGNGAVSTLPESPSVIDGSGIVSQIAGGGEITFTFAGTGWGHNVGMSQYGAREMAKQGFGYQEILKFYYRGTEVMNLSQL